MNLRIAPLGSLQIPILTCTTAASQIFQMLAFRAATGNAFTIFLAGFALTLTILPKISLLPAFVAGLVRIFNLHKPGIVNTPDFFTFAVAISARVSRAFAACAFLSSQAAANASAIPPLGMTLAPAFVAFFIGAILLRDSDVPNKI